MKLHIIRHAKPETYSSTGKDFNRKLLPKGITQSELLSDRLKTIKNLGAIWCSEAVRTRETLSIINPAQFNVEPTYFIDLYHAPRDLLLDKIWQNNRKEDLLIVGHNFGISELVAYYTDEPIELNTAEYVCLEFDCDSWFETSRGSGTMIDRYHPKVFV